MGTRTDRPADALSARCLAEVERAVPVLQGRSNLPFACASRTGGLVRHVGVLALLVPSQVPSAARVTSCRRVGAWVMPRLPGLRRPRSRSGRLRSMTHDAPRRPARPVMSRRPRDRRRTARERSPRNRRRLETARPDDRSRQRDDDLRLVVLLDHGDGAAALDAAAGGDATVLVTGRFDLTRTLPPPASGPVRCGPRSASAGRPQRSRHARRVRPAEQRSTAPLTPRADGRPAQSRSRAVWTAARRPTEPPWSPSRRPAPRTPSSRSTRRPRRWLPASTTVLQPRGPAPPSPRRQGRAVHACRGRRTDD